MSAAPLSCWSGARRVGRWIGAETQIALGRHFGPHDDAQRLPIFPILLGATGPGALPPFLSLFQTESWDGVAALPGDLLDQIRERAIVPIKIPFAGCLFVGLDAFPNSAHLFFGARLLVWYGSRSVETRPLQDKPEIGGWHHSLRRPETGHPVCANYVNRLRETVVDNQVIPGAFTESRSCLRKNQSIRALPG
jgi:hypothetical protein